MTDADFLSTGYYGLQTGILGITAVFTLVFAYLGGLRLFLSKEPLRFKIAIYIVFLGAFVFLHLFLYSASLFGQEWLDLQSAQADQDDGFYAENSVLINADCSTVMWDINSFAKLSNLRMPVQDAFIIC